MEKQEEIRPVLAKGGDEIFTSRWDRTQELLVDRDGNRWKRRLDSIARLIENASTCAAIAIENGSFLIATNKNFPPNSTEQGYLLINTVMTFFKKVAEGTNTEHDFREVFTHICQGAMSGLQLLAHRREELSQDSFIDRVIQSRDGEDFRGLRDYISEQAEEGHYPHDTGAAFVVCSALLKDFDKVIKFIHANKDVADDSPTARFIHAIIVYKTDNIITRDKLEGKVADSEKMHAEMRILALIEDKLKDKEKKDKYENYIGISKLCCLDCHAIIYAINHAGYNRQIDTRGAHNVQHSGNWNAPFNITGNAPRLIAPRVPKDSAKRLTKAKSQLSPFACSIVEKYDEAYRLATLKEGDVVTIGARDVSEYATHSQSSSEDEAEEIVIKQFLITLQTKRKILRQLATSQIPGITVDETIFAVIDELLKDINKKETKLNDWVSFWKAGDIIKYLSKLNDGKEFTILNNATRTAIAILADPAFVSETIASKFQPALAMLRSEIGRQPSFLAASTTHDGPKHVLEICDEQAAITATLGLEEKAKKRPGDSATDPREAKRPRL